MLRRPDFEQVHQRQWTESDGRNVTVCDIISLDRAGVKVLKT